jgi:Fur family ferric uptake transcriptional regulator
MTRLERLCEARGLRVTEHRRIVLEVLSAAIDRPRARDIHRRAAAGRFISLATVYRTLSSLVAAGIVRCHSVNDNEAHYEVVDGGRHDSIIDIATGRVVEVDDEALAELIRQVALGLGYRLVDYRLKMFAERSAAVRDEAT